MKRLRLLYLTYHENVLRAGILHTQVVQMLQQLGKLERLDRIVLLSFLSPQSLWKGKEHIPAFKAQMAESGVKVIFFPMLIPGKWKYPWSMLISLWAVPLFLVVLFQRIDIVHSRGYPAALIARLAAKFLGCKTVFDPRGPYPAEMVMNSIWTSGSLTEQYWNRLETKLLKESDATIGVTPEYRAEFLQRGAKRAIFVPNRTTTKVFRQAIQADSSKDFATAGPELLFIGELHSVWNDPGLVARHFLGLTKLFPNARLRLITTADTSKARQTLASSCVDLDKVTFQSCRPVEMPRAMQGATFGLIFRAVNVHSLWSVKIAEYLAAGIPIIADKSMVGLPLQIIQRKKLGVFVDPDDPASLEAIRPVVTDWQGWSSRCLEYAERRLDLSSTVRQHLRLYYSI